MNYKIVEQKTLKRSDIVFCVAAGSAPDAIFFGSSDGKVYEVDLAIEKPEPAAFSAEQGHSSYVTGLAAAAPGVVISGSYDRRLIWWDLETKLPIRVIEQAHGKWIRQVKVSPCGEILASVADDMVCRLWSTETGELIAELKGHDEKTPQHYPSMLFTCEFSPDGSKLATADKVGRIAIWNVSDGSLAETLEAPTMYTWDPDRRRHSIGGVRSLAFSPDGEMLAVGGMGKVGNIDHLQGKARIRLFELKSSETVAELEATDLKGLVERLVFHPRGKWLMACGGDHKGFSMLIDPALGKITTEVKVPSFHVHDFQIDKTASSIIAVGHNRIGNYSILET